MAKEAKAAKEETEAEAAEGRETEECVASALEHCGANENETQPETFPVSCLVVSHRCRNRRDGGLHDSRYLIGQCSCCRVEEEQAGLWD